MLSASVDAVPSPDPLGTNTCTATFSASGAVAPGTYTEYINVLTDGKKGVGAASDYITLTFTVT